MELHRTVYVCRGTGCASGGGDAIIEALRAEVAKRGKMNAEIDFSGCHGFCQQGPNVVVEPDGIFYTHVEPEDVAEIVSSHLQNGRPVERLFYRDPVTGQAIPHYADINFYEKHERIILRNCGHINPEKIDDFSPVA
ncbi:MAG: (2Fe-2S) ferredoxin domain-containing protein, partial [Chloroflexi bacterium]|nr:(2Fe-2S) ferredoxin domain-containing protein [Chloroflexota bacterium]